jgi:hypothetical protein
MVRLRTFTVKELAVRSETPVDSVRTVLLRERGRLALSEELMPSDRPGGREIRYRLDDEHAAALDAELKELTVEEEVDTPLPSGFLAAEESLLGHFDKASPEQKLVILERTRIALRSLERHRASLSEEARQRVEALRAWQAISAAVAANECIDVGDKEVLALSRVLATSPRGPMTRSLLLRFCKALAMPREPEMPAVKSPAVLFHQPGENSYVGLVRSALERQYQLVESASLQPFSNELSFLYCDSSLPFWQESLRTFGESTTKWLCVLDVGYNRDLRRTVLGKGWAYVDNIKDVDEYGLFREIRNVTRQSRASLATSTRPESSR